MRVLLPPAATAKALSDLVASDHPLQRLFEQALASRQSRGPVSIRWGAPSGPEGESPRKSEPAEFGERLSGMYVHLWQRRTDGLKLIFAQIVPTRP